MYICSTTKDISKMLGKNLGVSCPKQNKESVHMGAIICFFEVRTPVMDLSNLYFDLWGNLNAGVHAAPI